MFKLNSYLNFNGNTEEAFLFYKSVFGGEFEAFSRFSDAPDTPGMAALPAADKSKVMHVSLPIGNGMRLMGTDVLPAMGHKPAEGNNVSLSLAPETEDEARRLYAALSDGGDIEVPLEDMFWGALFGMVTDKFGIKWMVNFERGTK
jgi:PhnB protein